MGNGPGKHARKTSLSTTISLTISFAVVFAAVAAALLTRSADSGAAPNPQPPAASAIQPVTEGRLIAVSADSLTARGSDGVVRTYVVDANTHGITPSGSRIGGTSEAFAVNDEVAIVGVTRGDATLATTVAHRDATAGNGPPMDYALP